jgi:hypothetical protein
MTATQYASNSLAPSLSLCSQSGPHPKMLAIQGNSLAFALALSLLPFKATTHSAKILLAVFALFAETHYHASSQSRQPPNMLATP